MESNEFQIIPRAAPDSASARFYVIMHSNMNISRQARRTPHRNVVVVVLLLSLFMGVWAVLAQSSGAPPQQPPPKKKPPVVEEPQEPEVKGRTQVSVDVALVGLDVTVN